MSFINLYYGQVLGHSPATSWQMGMYFGSNSLNSFGAFNTWQAFLQNLFINGTIHAFGYQKYMTSSQGADWADLYVVNQLTDHKVKYNRIAFPTAGTAAGPSIPPQNAALVLLRPGITSNRDVGRMYLPPMASQAISIGALSPTAQTETADFLQDAFNQFTINSATPVVRNRLEHIDVPVTAYAVSNIIGTVRKRITPQRPAYVQRNL